LVFRLATNHRNDVIMNNEKLFLTAFNRETKENGFFSMQIDKKGDPELLSMGPYLYEIPGHDPDIPSFEPIKAKDANVYLIQRMSASQSPNYFITSDFKSFLPLSNLYPEKQYNWFQGQLLSWKNQNGKTFQG